LSDGSANDFRMDEMQTYFVESTEQNTRPVNEPRVTGPEPRKRPRYKLNILQTLKEVCDPDDFDHVSKEMQKIEH
jgi:hypothetical protein